MDYQSLFRKIKDYPIEGIVFEDVTTFWKDPEAFSFSINKLADYFKDRGINKVAALEARGFVIGAPIALLLGAGFVPLRKPGKLPAEVISESYSLEYGKNQIEVHKDAFQSGDNVLICDDILATGGTLRASESLITRLGAEIAGIAILSELTFLDGRSRLSTEDIYSLYQVNQ
ncbi:MAG: adenine phosphoribosyltransferase [Brevinemataceae bacterium]